jgi:hypothetical protein
VGLEKVNWSLRLLAGTPPFWRCVSCSPICHLRSLTQLITTRCSVRATPSPIRSFFQMHCDPLNARCLLVRCYPRLSEISENWCGRKAPGVAQQHEPNAAARNQPAYPMLTLDRNCFTLLAWLAAPRGRCYRQSARRDAAKSDGLWPWPYPGSS